MPRYCCARRYPAGTARFQGSTLRRLVFFAPGLVELVVGGWVAGGLGRRVDPGSRLAAWTCSSEDAIEAKMALLLMLHAKGSAAALINSKNSMWPVAEFSDFDFRLGLKTFP